MDQVRVKWTEGISASHFENVRGMFPDEADPHDFDRNYEGVVIGNTRSFWGDVYLTIACTDGSIRSVHTSKVEIIKTDNNGTDTRTKES